MTQKGAKPANKAQDQTATATGKTDAGRFFEDFTLGEVIEHGVPRTLTEGQAALYQALTGSRFALNASHPFARLAGYDHSPLDDILVFNLVFGQSVPDISLNAVANLGYAECDFLRQVMVGETISARSEVIGLKENSDGETGVVYVRTTGMDHRGVDILTYVRWVMIPKRDPKSPAPETVIPELADRVERLTIPRHRINRLWDPVKAGAPYFWEDYETGEKIDHRDGVTIEDAEHMMATRLYNNKARVHFDATLAAHSRFGKRVVYGGHIISLARALSFNGLGSACIVSAIHGGSHTAPAFAGDTIYAWTEVLETQAIENRRDIGALRLLTRAIKNRPADDFPTKGADVVLELDYTALLPKRR